MLKRILFLTFILCFAIISVTGCMKKTYVAQSSNLQSTTEKSSALASAPSKAENSANSPSVNNTEKKTTATTPKEQPVKAKASKSPSQPAQTSTELKSAETATKPANVEEQAIPANPESVRGMLLSSAGRTLEEQEEDFVLQVPELVYKGEPFIVHVAGEGLLQMTVVWNNRQVTVQAGENGQAKNTAKVAFATSLDEKANAMPINIYLVWEDKQETMTAEIPLAKRTYKEQHLKVAQKYVTPDPSVTAKIQQDRANFKKATTQITPHKYWELPLYRPVPGNLSSTFGLRRFFNGEERAPHRGLDFRAQQGDPIKALAAGTVTLAEEQYFGGYTVIVDHGLGVFSVYLHLSKFNVKAGDFVERGQTLGLIGQTGRVTGPHLHLSLVVMGENIDPAPFLKL